MSMKNYPSGPANPQLGRVRAFFFILRATIWWEISSFKICACDRDMLVWIFLVINMATWFGFRVESWETRPVAKFWKINQKCFLLPPIVVCSFHRSIQRILSFPLYSISHWPIVCRGECYHILYLQRTHITSPMCIYVFLYLCTCTYLYHVFVNSCCTVFVFAPDPHYPLHCVHYYPPFVRKCAKYHKRHINRLPVFRISPPCINIHPRGKTLQYVCGWKGHSARICDTRQGR